MTELGQGAETTAEAVSGARRARPGVGWIAAIVLVAVVLLAAVVPSPFAIERPGPVVNALGAYAAGDDAEVPVIAIDGAESYADAGALNVLSVSIVGSPDHPADWLELLGAALDPTRSVVPLNQLYPAGVDAERRQQQNDAMMRSSQLAATAAALRQLDVGFTETISVAGVVPGGPAAGVLHDGDVIESANGKPIAGLAGLREALTEVPEGAAMRLGIVRHGTTQQVMITPQTAGDGSRMIGVGVASEFEFPFSVTVRLGEIGGPSAGLVFALAIYDRLTPDSLTGGDTISATGTMNSAGEVGAIGGLVQKIHGAARAGSTAMLMPLQNCAELPRSLPRDMQIIPVGTLDEAIAALDTLRSGGTPAGVERCPGTA